MEEWFLRSGQTPLSLDLDFDYLNLSDLSRFLQTVLPNPQQFHFLRLLVFPNALPQLQYLKDRFINLHTLDLVVGGGECSNIFENSPSLREVRLSNLSNPIPKLPWS